MIAAGFPVSAGVRADTGADEAAGDGGDHLSGGYIDGTLWEVTDTGMMLKLEGGN